VIDDYGTYGIDEHVHAENRRRAQSLGQTELFYFDKWALSGLITDIDMSVALDVYEEEGYREFVRFIGLELPDRLRPGATVRTLRYLKGHPKTTRDTSGIIKEVTPDYVKVRFYGTTRNADYVWMVDNDEAWSGDPDEPFGNAFSLGDFPVDVEIIFSYGIDDFVYDLGLGPDDAFEAKEFYWKVDEVDFFGWFVDKHNLPVATLSVDPLSPGGWQGLGARITQTELRYVDAGLPNTLTLIDELLIATGPLEETIEAYRPGH